MEETFKPDELQVLLKNQDVVTPELICKLKKTKATLIESMNFEEVERIDNCLKIQAQMSYDEVMNRLKIGLDEVVNDIYDRYNESTSQITDRSKSKEVQIRAAINTIFGEMKQRHINELTELTVEKEISVEQSKRKPVVKTIELNARARKVALIQDVRRAIEMRESAKLEETSEMTRRIDEIETRYVKAMNAAILRQKRELKNLEASFMKQVQDANKCTKDELQQSKKKAASSIRKELSKAIANGRRIIKDHLKYHTISSGLTEFLENKLWNEKRGYIFQE